MTTHITDPRDRLAQLINDALPQTQCTQCGFKGCAPYAHAIAFDNEPINQCPPGGAAGVMTLANLTGREVLPLNPANGIEIPRHVALIVEQDCIGCTKCITACPVDAIIGTAKFMHTVLTDVCTGCGLCVPPCPVDCIEMPLASNNPHEWTTAQANNARQRYEFRNIRLIREKHELNETRIQKSQAKHQHLQSQTDIDAGDKAHKISIVEAALARARARRTVSGNL